MTNINYEYLNDNLPFDVVELICKKIYSNRLEVIRLEKLVFKKWKKYVKLCKLNKFINFILYNNNIDLLPDMINY